MTKVRSKADLEHVSAATTPLRDPVQQAEVDRILAALNLATQIVATSGRLHTTEEAMRVFWEVRRKSP